MKRVFFIGVSIGNQEHTLDRKRIYRYLHRNGLPLVGTPAEADIIICDTCLFHYEATLQTIENLRRVKKSGALLAITGPLASRPELVGYPTDMVFLPNHRRNQLDHWLGAQIPFDETEDTFRNDFNVLTIPVSYGCLQECTFCVDKIGFGPLYSRPPDAVLKTFHQLMLREVEHICLIGQNTAVYGWDIGINLAHLLQRLMRESSTCRFDLENLNPDFLFYLDRFKDVLATERIASICIPVIATTDPLIRRAGKQFSISDLSGFLHWLTMNAPKTKITLILITGFPGEGFTCFKSSLHFMLQHARSQVDYYIYAYKDIPFAESYRLPGKVLQPEIDLRQNLLKLLNAVLQEGFQRQEALIRPDRFALEIYGAAYESMLSEFTQGRQTQNRTARRVCDSAVASATNYNELAEVVFQLSEAFALTRHPSIQRLYQRVDHHLNEDAGMLGSSERKSLQNVTGHVAHRKGEEIWQRVRSCFEIRHHNMLSLKSLAGTTI